MLRALPLIALFACGRFGFGDVPGGPHGDAGTNSSDGSVQGFAPFWTSGSRLRARLWRPIDGSDPYFEYWRDTMLDTDCTSNNAADGAERCIPLHARADQFFADAACTQRLTWSHFGPCGHDAYAFYADTAGRHHELPILAPYTGPVYDGSCTAITAPSTGTLYSLGAEVPASTFLPTGYETRTIGSFPHVITKWPDGAEYDDGSFAMPTGPCDPVGGIGSGTTACLPTSDPALVPVYTDSQCTQRAFYWDGNSNSPVGTAEFIVMNPTLCGHPYDYYTTGADVTGATYYTLGLGTCTSHATPAGAHVFAGTLSVPPYPSGTIAPGPVHGRLGYLYWTGSDGIAIPVAFWDHQLGRSCWPFLASDGVFRCLPRRPLLVAGYPNATCSGATTSLAGNCYGDVPANSPSYPSCDDQWGDVTLMPASPSGSYAGETTCTQFPGTTYLPGGSAGIVPASTFEQLTEVIE